MPARGFRTPAAVRFWKFVDHKGPDDCWLWKGAVVAGYGVFATDVRIPGGASTMAKAHRFSYVIATGYGIPEGAIVCHRCDVPTCVNPAHLFLGTHTDNRRDQIAKNRAPSQTRGWRHRAVLTAQQVEEIRPQRGVRPASALAPEYGVGVQAIYDIWQGRSWVQKA